MTSRVTLEIDLDNLRSNFRTIADTVAPLGVIAVLKADAYGLGVQAIAEALARAGASAIAVHPPSYRGQDTGTGAILTQRANVMGLYIRYIIVEFRISLLQGR